MKNFQIQSTAIPGTATDTAQRRGSTLVIVLALLGLLSFMGMLFYSFAAQERAASENFSEAAKFAVDEPPNVFDHMLRQVIVGPNDRPADRTSILRSSTRRHSMVTNLVGSDVHPHTGEGIQLAEAANGVPFVDQNGDGTADAVDWLEFVDSPVARPHVGYRERGLDGQTAPPAPDVDYTYPDINNLFLAFRGKAIRDNGPGTDPRYEEVDVLIPSFHRPQYLKSGPANGPGGNFVPTDANWVSAFDGVNRNTAVYASRSFRPHPQHIAGRLPDGTVVYRYLTSAEATTLGLNGGFPFIPEDTANGNGTPVKGEMGVWTGSHPSVYELDSDNDGDGTKEGIWLDLNYPIQETEDGTKYAILHSVTIYDLDSLINLNVHGNLAGLNRLGDLTQAGAGLVRDGQMSNQFISRSNLGLGPNEINPLWAMIRTQVSLGELQTPPPAPQIDPFSDIRDDFYFHYGNRLPATVLEAANMEWLWMMTGRGVFVSSKLDNIFAGRWGEAERTYNTYKAGGSRNVADLPRPGRSGNAQETGSSGIRFGGTYAGAGRNGFDDNLDRLEGEADLSQRRLRAFGTPMDYAGTGRTTAGVADQYNGSVFARINNSPRTALMHHDGTSTGPERWLRYQGYTINRAMVDTVPRYAFGQDGVFNQGLTTSDDLVEDPLYDALFEDPLETIFDPEYAQRQFDQVFSPGDLLELHIPRPSKGGTYGLSQRLSNLAPFALEWSNDNNVREKFTTLSNSLRRFMLRHDLGADLQLNTADDGPRAWEFSADTDGNSDNNGYGQGDGKLEFPPAFGSGVATGKPFSATDPFRPQVRRLLTVEAGEGRELIGQLPLSLNHILDVERTVETPDELTQPVQFLRYMRRTGLRFRPLTEHPSATEGTTVLSATSVPKYDPAVRVAFPPVTPEQREFWARRDRQQLARDIYVLLYTIGGAQRDPSNAARIRNYLGTNDPNAAEGSSLYTHRQLREMAQFAVNLVDAMDADDVITKFEYDKNLGPDGSGTGGWNLDDDPYTMEVNPLPESDPNFSTTTDRGRHREDSLSRGVVYGVESQQVAFSEVLGVGAATPVATGDHPATLYADDVGRHHLFVELQNLSPLPVNLATAESTTMDKAVWRIVRHDRTSAADPIGGTSNGGNPFRAFAFLGKSSVNQTIAAGQRYTIASASDASVISSDLYVDHNLDNTFDLIAPATGGAPLPTNTTNKTDQNAAELKPRCTLDLIHPDHSLAFLMVDQAGNQTNTAGAFLQTLQTYQGNTPMTDLRAGDFAMSGQEGFDLVLQRRANPNMPSLNHGAVAGEDPNPWVDVDIIKVAFRDLAINDGDMSTELQQNRLPNITSEERAEPLSDSTRALFSAPPPANLRYNTISRTNSNTSASGFTLWQAHFDRDYASSGELLSLPLCGPGKLTSMIARLGDSPTLQATPPGATNPTPALLVAAASKILQADFPNDSGQSADANRARDNRWYRLLQFVEVPSRVHRMLGNYVALDRVPGKLNLNTLRHWEVYAGLIDNPILLDKDDLKTTGRVTVDRTPNSSNTAVNRDRWQELLLSRDGGPTVTWDPVTSTAKSMLLPGTAKARPFRSLGYRRPATAALEADNGQEATILRTQRDDVLDGDPTTNRNWLEVNDANQHKNPRPTSLMHQHQVLSKIMNNTTTVSNTFIIYATAGYFEAVEHEVGGQGTGLYRIGSRIDLDTTGQPNENPGWQQRAVFIIDRTEAFKAYDPGTGDFDWKRLVKATAVIE